MRRCQEARSSLHYKYARVLDLIQSKNRIPFVVKTLKETDNEITKLKIQGI